MNIFGALNTARTSILTQQIGITVTGQNLANVNTPGYSRQQVRLEASSPVMAGKALIGTGVRLAGIRREADSFITAQINNTASNQSFYESADRAVALLETVLNEADNLGLTHSLSRFFNSFHDLAVNAQGMTERASVISTASLMTDNVRRLASDLKRTQNDMEDQIKEGVSQANLLTADIANLNQKIHETENGDVVANDLRDQRDVKVKELAKILDISVYEDTGNNQLMVTTSTGRHLVLGQTAFQLETTVNGNNKGLTDININDGQGNLTNITQEITSGSLFGNLHMRDTVIPDYLSRFDKFAAGIIREVNRLHTSGFGLDKKFGINFFDNLSVTSRENVNNTGNAAISGTVAQQGFVSTDDYRIDITGTGTFVLNNLTTGLASGTFTFVSGSAVDLGNGINITLSGTAQTGDQFTLSSSEDAALTMKINSIVSNDPNKIAAGKTLFPGDGTNATDIADLQNSFVFSGNRLLAGSGTVTFQDFFGALVGDVGIERMQSSQGQEHQQAISNQLFSQRENIAGVSIDEEMVNIIKFQQAYNASAKIIVTIEDMLNSLQQAV